MCLNLKGDKYVSQYSILIMVGFEISLDSLLNL